MRKLMTPPSILLLLAAALVALSIVGDRRVSAQGSSPVLVTNPSTSPVPVTGHVTLSGEHGHPLLVNLSNTPVPVTISTAADNPDRHPFQKLVTGEIPTGQNTSGTFSNTFTAPADKAIILDNIEIDCFAITGKQCGGLVDTVQGGLFLKMSPDLGAPPFAGVDHFIGSQSSHLIIMPGNQYRVFTYRNTTTGVINAGWNVTLSGHYVDCTAAPCTLLN